MLARLVAAVLIAFAALVLPGVSGEAKADPRGGWGRGRSRRWRRGRGWGYHAPQPDSGAVGGFLGGMFGSWLWNQLDKPEPEPHSDYVPDDEEEDEKEEPRRRR